MANKAFTHKTAENAKPKDKAYKLSTGRGFYLFVSPSGKKVWRYEYRLNTKRNTVTYGEFPVMGLIEAEKAHIECKKLLSQGLCPNQEKKRIKAQTQQAAQNNKNTFEHVAYEWLEKRMCDKSVKYQHDLKTRLEYHILPSIGKTPIGKLDPSDFLIPLRKVEERGSFEMAHRLAQIIKQVCQYAKVAGYVKYNEAIDITGALRPKPKQVHMPAITDPFRLGELLKNIDSYNGNLSTKYALKIMPYVFVRNSELRCAKWEEFDLTKRQWLIPAERMKMKREHIVPLAAQVITLLEELKDWSGHIEILFPGILNKCRPVTDMCLLNALRRMGYGRDEMCIHGFRGTASTLLNEQGYRKDVIEAQLAHKEENKVREAYNHALYLPDRQKMMQEWADYLDGLKAQAIT